MVSVIIGIYNVLTYIDRGIKQVLEQTYQDFEILLVDDGSTDGSLAQCHDWAKKDSRIRVLHQDNHGVGSARNLGMRHAKGEYLYFFDIDDMMDKHLLEYNVKQMELLNVDFILFGYKNIDTKYGSETTIRFPEALINSNQELRNVYVDNFILKVNGFAWNKFYRKSFLEKYNLHFEDQRIQQDEVFNLMVYEHLEKAYISPDVFYTYYVYEKGNTRSRFIPDRFDIYKSVYDHFEHLKDFWHLNDRRLDNYMLQRFYNSVMQCMLFNLPHPRNPWSKKEKKAEMARIMADHLTLDAFAYAEEHINGIEQRLYRHACRHQNLLEMTLYVNFFRILRNIKRRIL